MNVDDICFEIIGSKFVAVDTETDGNDVRDGSGYLTGLSISTGRTSCYLPFRHGEGDNLILGEWVAPLTAALNSTTLVFHNAKFDIPSLATAGIKVTGKFYDTMLMAHWINENWPDKSLDWLGKRLLGEGKSKSLLMDTIVKAYGWAAVPSQVMAPYAEQDARLTLKLFNKLFPEFKKQGFDGELWDIEQRFLRLIITMESNGILIDQQVCKTQAERGRACMEKCAANLGFNPGSPLQLGNYLLNDLKLPVVATTPGGKPCFDKNAMLQYDELLEGLGNERANAVSEYRGWSKATAVAYAGYPILCSFDGRLRPNYQLHGTVTGRLSCRKPNLQQIPRSSKKQWDGALKACFIPKPDHELWEADYSQLELRLGAAYAGEKSLISEFAKLDSDVFARMAYELGFSRGDTKTLTYTLQYGGGINRLCTVFKVDEHRAATIRDTYFSAYPGFKSITQRAARKAESQGYIKLWSGRRRHFQHPRTESFKAFNSVIQGGSAEIVKRSMLRLSEAGLSKYMLLQVHDSVVFEIPSDVVYEILPLIKGKMEDVNSDRDFGVRFAVQIKRWGES